MKKKPVTFTRYLKPDLKLCLVDFSSFAHAWPYKNATEPAPLQLNKGKING